MNTTHRSRTKSTKAEILREYGPFPGKTPVHGVTFDGAHVWFARGEALVELDPESGEVVRELAAEGDAGTAFDGRHLWQLAEGRIDKLDPQSGKVLASIPSPSKGNCSGLAWAEGSLWVGEYRARRILQLDPATGKVLRTIESDRFVTGVSWVNGELWHGTWEGEESELRHIDAQSGEVLERVEMPAGVGVSGLEADARNGVFYCGGGESGKVRAVRKPA